MLYVNHSFRWYKLCTFLGLLCVALPRLAVWTVGAAATELPVLTNLWQQEHLVIIDKDTNSVFINANERFLATLRPTFPEIQTVADLVGKDDFYFYPTDLAVKYRADDQRVLQSGQPFETIEVNQPLGGTAAFFYVTKIPLRDTNNLIYALRIISYAIPAPNQTTLPVYTNAWDLAHLYTMDKDTNGVFINANELYLRSLQPAFPEIRSVTNLIGKDDYYFYPTNLAEKYRADDQQTIQSGQPFETIEVNQPQGGAASYVYVSKTPLRDTNNVIFALRIVFYAIPAPNQTTLPIYTTSWDREHICVIDKDTNSIYLNANEPYVQSLRPSFPDIRSVTNLIGKDDYYFYPTNLAEKYRADDQRTIQSGQPFETIEVNQPQGGAASYVYVNKIPLRDTNNVIYALRIVFFELPTLTAQRTAQGMLLEWQGDGTGFVLQQTHNLLTPGMWAVVTAPKTVTNNLVSVLVPTTEAAAFYRLQKE
jgi:hypothetical protein